MRTCFSCPSCGCSKFFLFTEEPTLAGCDAAVICSGCGESYDFTIRAEACERGSSSVREDEAMGGAGDVSADVVSAEEGGAPVRSVAAGLQWEDSLGRRWASKESALRANREIMDTRSRGRFVRDMTVAAKLANCLILAGVQTVEDLTRLRASDVLRIPGVGRTYLQEIREELYDMNLSLKEDGDWVREKESDSPPSP